MSEQNLSVASLNYQATIVTLRDAAALRDEVVLQGAVRGLENHLESSVVSVDKVVNDLLEPRLLEFTLSGKCIVSKRFLQPLYLLISVYSRERCGGATNNRLDFIASA